MVDLEGKVAVVTGGGSGIGRSECLRLAADGASVVVNDFWGDAAQETAAMVRDAGGRAIAVAGDVSQWSVGKSLVDAAVDVFGDLDILVNNAGISRPRMIFNMTEDDWDSVINVHLKGSFVGTKFASMYWRGQAKVTGKPVDASVLMTTSGMGLHGSPGHINYVAAKGGIASMTKTLALELRPYGVRVNAIAPLAFSGMTNTLWGGAAFTEDRREELSPENVAVVVGWLVSPRSLPVSGQVIQFSGKELSTVDQWPAIGRAQTNEAMWTYERLDAVGAALFRSDERHVP